MNNSTPYFIPKEKSKPETPKNKNHSRTASLQNNRNFTEPKDFTKTLDQNNKFKKTSLAQKAKASLTPEWKNKSPAYRKCSTPKSEQDNMVVVVEDDDLIPPTPSPAGQHSFINCQGQKLHLSINFQHSQSSSDLSQADNSKEDLPSKKFTSLFQRTGMATKRQDINGNKLSSQDNGTVTVVHDHLSTANSEHTLNRKAEVQVNNTAPGNNLAVMYSVKESDSHASSCNSVEMPSTHATRRKKYKLSRKPKPSKVHVVSSPLKKHDVSGLAAQSPQNNKQLQKGMELPGQELSNPVIAPSKCVVLRSRLKRPAVKGSSPLQKRLQTEMPLPVKVLFSI